MNFTATITRIRQETPTIKSFVLDYGDQPFTFLPGQWIDLSVNIDGETHMGGYSMTSSPLEQGSFQLAVKRSETHPVTRYLYERAVVGDTVTISNGSGTFVYRPGLTDSVVLIGAGVGVTPLLSILRYIHATQPQVRVTLLYSVAVPGEVLFAEQLQAMAQANPNVRLLITVTQPEGTGWQGLTGRIDAAMLARAGLHPDTHYFICGPNAMVDETAAMLARLDIPAAHIIYEKWW